MPVLQAHHARLLPRIVRGSAVAQPANCFQDWAAIDALHACGLRVGLRLNAGSVVDLVGNAPSV
jgi:hypothetical protein